MTIKVTITVPDTKIGNLLARLDGYKALCEHVTEQYVPGWDNPRKGKPNGAGNTHSRAASLLTMTGKIAQPSSKIAEGMTVFEKLEKKKGIGNVNVGDFREALIKKELPKALSQRCVTEKFLSYI